MLAHFHFFHFIEQVQISVVTDVHQTIVPSVGAIVTARVSTVTFSVSPQCNCKTPHGFTVRFYLIVL